MAKRKSRRSSPAAAGETAPDAATPAATADPRRGLLVSVTAACAALVIASSFFPATRLWGINHLAFLPAAARLTLIALLALSFVPPLARLVYRAALRASAALSVERADAAAMVSIAVVAILSISLFYTNRSATLLLGDGQLITKSFEAAEEGHPDVIMRNARTIVHEEPIAPGATLIYYGAIKTLDHFKKPPLFSMQMLNCVLGGIFVFVFLLVAANRSMSAETRVWLVILGLFSSSMLLFYGYIENYTAPLLFLAVYVVLAFRAIHRRGSLWLALIPLVLAVYAHIQSILFVPSFVFLLLWRGGRKQRQTLLRRWMPLYSTAAVLGIVAAGLLTPLRKFYVPFGLDNTTYGLFSPDHLADVLNELLMLLPILPTVLVLGWIGRRAERASGRDPLRDPRATRDPTEWFSHPVEFQFVGTILVPCGLYVLLFHPEIGMARDWDLFTMTSTALVPMVLLVWNRYRRTTGATEDLVAGFAVPALLVVMVTGASWVGINASLPRTIDRFQRILTYDKTHASYAWENLAILQHDRGDLKDAIATMERAVDVSHNPRQIVRLAVYIEEDGRTDEAIDMLEKVLERRPAYTKARFRLVMFLEKTNQWDKMLDVARDGVKYSPGDAIYAFFYGESLMRAGRTDEAIAVFRSCRTMDLPRVARDYVEATLKKADEKK